jgi:hypothetical protein
MSNNNRTATVVRLPLREVADVSAAPMVLTAQASAAQAQRAWARMAEAAAAALTDLGPRHPARAQFLVAWRESYRAAGLTASSTFTVVSR